LPRSLKTMGELWSTNEKKHLNLWRMTLKFNRFLEVVEVDGHAKRAICSL